MVNNEAQDIVKEFARAMDQATLRSFEMKIEEAISLYDNIEASFLPRISENQDVFLELKRRLSEHKFYLMVDRNQSLKDVNRYYDAICKFGFTNLERKATVEIIFARYYLQNNEPQKAREMMINLYRELKEALVFNDLEIYRDLIKNIELISNENNLGKIGGS